MAAGRRRLLVAGGAVGVGASVCVDGDYIIETVVDYLVEYGLCCMFEFTL